MDFVFLRSFESVLGKNNLRNVISEANVDVPKFDNQVYNCGNVVANELFHVEADHIFLESAINVFNRTLLSGEYTFIGHLLFTKALDVTCGQENIKKSSLSSIDYDREKCSGMKIVKPRFFYPLNLIDVRVIQSYNYWYQLFKSSVAINFSKRFTYYGSVKEDANDKLNPSNRKVLRPKDYGKNKPAMTYIGSIECPLSFFSTSPF